MPSIVGIIVLTTFSTGARTPHERAARLTIDGISTWFGKAAAWLIVGLMVLVCPKCSSAISSTCRRRGSSRLNMLYGTLFMIGGAYTLAQNAHVRGDFLYSSMRPRTRPHSISCSTCFPARHRGFGLFASDSLRINEHSNVTADGPPVYHSSS